MTHNCLTSAKYQYRSHGRFADVSVAMVTVAMFQSDSYLCQYWSSGYPQRWSGHHDHGADVSGTSGGGHQSHRVCGLVFVSHVPSILNCHVFDG